MTLNFNHQEGITIRAKELPVKPKNKKMPRISRISLNVGMPTWISMKSLKSVAVLRFLARRMRSMAGEKWN
jgi:hypothetical protein